jgi:hypothetical protein
LGGQSPDGLETVLLLVLVAIAKFQVGTWMFAGSQATDNVAGAPVWRRFLVSVLFGGLTLGGVNSL